MQVLLKRSLDYALILKIYFYQAGEWGFLPPPKAQTPMNAQVSTRKVLLILNSRLERHHLYGAPKEQALSHAVV